MKRYYKRVVNGVVEDLHIMEDNGEYVLSVVYPHRDEDTIFLMNDLQELEDLDAWLDAGLENGIFTSFQQPPQSV